MRTFNALAGLVATVTALNMGPAVACGGAPAESASGAEITTAVSNNVVSLSAGGLMIDGRNDVYVTEKCAAGVSDAAKAWIKTVAKATCDKGLPTYSKTSYQDSTRPSYPQFQAFCNAIK